jgi:hypothetical protein
MHGELVTYPGPGTLLSEAQADFQGAPVEDSPGSRLECKCEGLCCQAVDTGYEGAMESNVLYAIAGTGTA